MPTDGGRTKTQPPTIARRRTAGVDEASGHGVSVVGQYPDWRQDPLDPLAAIGVRSKVVEPDTSKLRLGPLEKVYLIWMVGASCDGCSVAATGATHPRVEHLLAGIIPGLPRVELIHT
ncbi:MAG: hypothetical protein M3314_01125, partial [Actinomycetota bacterium]|nr:hypothetical protein [Actinomycetota bacterium]